MKIMKLGSIVCIGKADENPIDQESGKNLTGERSLRILTLTACVRPGIRVESWILSFVNGFFDAG